MTNSYFYILQGLVEFQLLVGRTQNEPSCWDDAMGLPGPRIMRRPMDSESDTGFGEFDPIDLPRDSIGK